MTPALEAGAERAVSGRGPAGAVVWAAALAMTSSGIRQAASSRTARIVNKRLVPPTARRLAIVRHQRWADASAAHHSDGLPPMLVAASARDQSVSVYVTL